MFRPLLAYHVPFVQKHFNQSNQHLRFVWVNPDYKVNVVFHVSANIADLAYSINRVPNVQVNLKATSKNLRRISAKSVKF